MRKNLFGKNKVFRRLNLPFNSCVNLHLISYTSSDYLANDDVCAGLGVDWSENLAFTKSIAEYLERKAFYELDHSLKTSNGMAAHIFSSLAFKKAEAELLERDALFRHWYTKTPFNELIVNSGWVQKVKMELALKGFELKLAQTYLGFAVTTVCFLVDQRSGGFAIGCEANGEEVFRAEKATQEALINLYFGDRADDFAQASERTENGQRINSLQDHRAYWRYLNQLPQWVFAKTSCETALVNSRDENVQFQRTRLKSFPFSVVYAESPQVIPLVIGRWNLEDNNKYNLSGTEGEIVHPLP